MRAAISATLSGCEARTASPPPCAPVRPAVARGTGCRREDTAASVISRPCGACSMAEKVSVWRISTRPALASSSAAAKLAAVADRRRPGVEKSSQPIGQVAHQVGPVAGVADHARRIRSMRLLHGQHMIAVHHIGAEVVAGADARIGLHQVDQARGLGDPARRRQLLRGARGESGPCISRSRAPGSAWRHNRASPPAARAGSEICAAHLLARRPLLARVGRQQATAISGRRARPAITRVIGGQFDPERAGLLDEDQA